MFITPQAVAANSSLLLDALQEIQHFPTHDKRIGLDKHGELILFKGLEFLLHPKECMRARALLKRNNFCDGKASSPLFMELRLSKAPATQLLAKMREYNSQAYQQRERPLNVGKTLIEAGMPDSVDAWKKSPSYAQEMQRDLPEARADKRASATASVTSWTYSDDAQSATSPSPRTSIDHRDGTFWRADSVDELVTQTGTRTVDPASLDASRPNPIPKPRRTVPQPAPRTDLLNGRSPGPAHPQPPQRSNSLESTISSTATFSTALESSDNESDVDQARSSVDQYINEMRQNNRVNAALIRRMLTNGGL